MFVGRRIASCHHLCDVASMPRAHAPGRGEIAAAAAAGVGRAIAPNVNDMALSRESYRAAEAYFTGATAPCLHTEIDQRMAGVRTTQLSARQPSAPKASLPRRTAEQCRP